MEKPKILIQLDTDPNPSTFDSIVALDAGVDQLIPHGNVTEENVSGLVHGAMFTRGPDDLHRTALFFGGSDVQATGDIVTRAAGCFFGPIRVSYLSDPNGSNTTAAAAVLCAEKHLALDSAQVTILAGTGPVGLRIAQIIASSLAQPESSPTRIRIVSRNMMKAQGACRYLTSVVGHKRLFEPFQADSSESTLEAVSDADAIFAAGAAGVQLLPKIWIDKFQPKIAVDLNAVPPSGIAGIEATDRGKQRSETVCYGAIGVGGLKMKIHKRCLAALFESNDKTLETEEVYQIGKSLD